MSSSIHIPATGNAPRETGYVHRNDENTWEIERIELPRVWYRQIDGAEAAPTIQTLWNSRDHATA